MTVTHVQAGTVRVLAVFSAQRTGVLPEVPAIAERLPGFEVLTWNGVVGPAGLREEVAGALNAAIRRALADAEVATQLERLGLDAAPSSPGEFGRFIEAQIAHFAELIRIAGVEPS